MINKVGNTFQSWPLPNHKLYLPYHELKEASITVIAKFAFKDSQPHITVILLRVELATFG